MSTRRRAGGNLKLKVPAWEMSRVASHSYWHFHLHIDFGLTFGFQLSGGEWTSCTDPVETEQDERCEGKATCGSGCRFMWTSPNLQNVLLADIRILLQDTNVISAGQILQQTHIMEPYFARLPLFDAELDPSGTYTGVIN